MSKFIKLTGIADERIRVKPELIIWMATKVDGNQVSATKIAIGTKELVVRETVEEIEELINPTKKSGVPPKDVPFH